MSPPASSQPHLAPGYRLDQRYELLAPVAQGGMAVVWVARVVGKLGLEKLYAVKTILPHLSGDPAFRTMFLDEAKIASRIRHPNVVALEDLGEENGQLYMALEWVHGDALNRLSADVKSRGASIPPNILLRILADACAGLHAAHELRDDTGSLLNVVHRDISPQNLLITTSGVTKVIDFGIATAVDRMAEKTKKGLLKGKLQYAAPEQVRMQKVDRRADVWALGVILYEYLSGRLPFDAERDLDIVEMLATETPPPALPPHIPPNLANVALTALRPRRDERFPSALDMQRALEACLTAPTTTTDVATFLQENMASRLETRRREIADAVRAADERAGSAYRPRLASIPELLPIGDSASLPESTDLPSTVTAPTRVTQLTRDHWVAMVVAIIVTASVWAAILFVLSGGMSRPR
ncbi:MAG: serine/threonine protein kinase [Polyangiaceae bacterium]|nr:serine/threonine protein kinase [Polyangiaceae bacterium]